MKKIIHIIYDLLFSNDQEDEPIPYKQKAIVVYITLTISLITVGLIAKFIIKNISNIVL